MSGLQVLTPRSIEDAGRQASTYAPGEAAIVGGGTMMVPSLTRREVRPRVAIDLGAAGMSWIGMDDETLSLGAMTTYADLIESEVVRAYAPLLWLAAQTITGGPQIRHMGTVGGSVCRASPASDMPAVLVASDARLVIHGPDAVREIHVLEFLRAPFATDLRPHEILCEIRIPAHPKSVGYSKFKLAESSWPVVTSAAILRGNERDGWSGSVAIGGVQGVPWVNAIRVDPGPFHTSGIGALREEYIRSHLGDVWDDDLAPSDYRLSIAGVVASRAVASALEVADDASR